MFCGFHCKVFHFLVKLVPTVFFIPFDGTVNITVFLIFFSNYSLLVYTNATDFHVSNLYLATLLNSLIS